MAVDAERVTSKPQPTPGSGDPFPSREGIFFGHNDGRYVGAASFGSHIRSASIRVTREARRAGRAPPRMPTKAANSMPCRRILGVIRKLKSTSLKFVKLAVPVEMPC